MPFWDRNHAILRKLTYLAVTALGVPASNIPTECVFSHSRIAVNSYRACVCSVVCQLPSQLLPTSN